MADMAHYCSACGEVHGGNSRESEEVKIAKINADRDIEVAKLAARVDRDSNETQVAVAEVMGEAQVETAVAEAEVLGDAIEATQEPEIIVEPPAEPAAEVISEPEPDAEPPPGSEVPEPAKKSGYWDAYR